MFLKQEGAIFGIQLIHFVKTFSDTLSGQKQQQQKIAVTKQLLLCGAN